MGTSWSSLGIQTFGVELSAMIMWLRGGIMSSVWGMILQWVNTIKVSIEIPFATRHRRTGWPLVRETSGKLEFSSRSGKSQGILQIGQGIFKYQESQGKVREFIILAQNMCCSRYFDYLKNVVFFSRSLELRKLVDFRTFCAKKLFKDFICFICRIREVHFSELVKGICHLSAARRQIGRKTAVFWSVKNWIWSGKSQWKVRDFCFCLRVATLVVIWLKNCWKRR